MSAPAQLCVQVALAVLVGTVWFWLSRVGGCVVGVFSRAVSLAAVPVAASARLGVASARSVLGADGEALAAAASARTVEHLASSLAKARGPALKFGQVVAVMSSSLPPEQAQLLAPLSRLYEDAQARELSGLGSSLSQLPPGLVLEPVAVAAASLGQVHRGVWVDGSPVAVKVQYPDARKVVRSDMAQVRALAPLLSRLVPSLDVKAIVAEHAARLEEELDYRFEARWMEVFASAWAGSAVIVPRVLFASERVLVCSWLEGEGFSLVRDASQEVRNLAAQALLEFTFDSPRRVGASHADAHPGNFRVLPGGGLGVLDFGSIAQGSGVFTRLLCDTLTLAALASVSEPVANEGFLARVRDAWVQCGLASAGVSVEELARVLDVDGSLMLGPVRMNSEFLARSSRAFTDPAEALERVGVLRFPPEFLLEHRALGGALALACSLDAVVDVRSVVLESASADVRSDFLAVFAVPPPSLLA